MRFYCRDSTHSKLRQNRVAVRYVISITLLDIKSYDFIIILKNQYLRRLWSIQGGSRNIIIIQERCLYNISQLSKKPQTVLPCLHSINLINYNVNICINVCLISCIISWHETHASTLFIWLLCQTLFRGKLQQLQNIFLFG